MNTTTFLPADLLLPHNCDLTHWAVIASDQYINEEDYWQTVENFVGRHPSTLRLTLPESCLLGPDFETDIMAVNSTMSEYLRKDGFQQWEDSFLYVQRTLPNGAIRWGIVGMIDLESYDAQGQTLIRGGESTLSPRIPPRVATRKNAPLEVSHIILLADDLDGGLCREIVPDTLEKVYDFPLMEGGGHLRGWRLGEKEKAHVLAYTAKLGSEDSFRQRYGNDAPVLQFAVGDGNHSLSTAKECYERQKKFIQPSEWGKIPARYALVELVNLHDPAVELSPFHRVIGGIDPKEFLRDFRVQVETLPENDRPSQEFSFYFGEHSAQLTVRNPVSALEVCTFQEFLDQWLLTHPNATVDYIQEEEVARRRGERKNTICIILPQLNKAEFFPTLVDYGILPKKAYTLGLPDYKRFYLEARKIR